MQPAELFRGFRMLLQKHAHDLSLFDAEMEKGMFPGQVQQMEQLFVANGIVFFISMPPDQIGMVDGIQDDPSVCIFLYCFSLVDGIFREGRTDVEAAVSAAFDEPVADEFAHGVLDNGKADVEMLREVAHGSQAFAADQFPGPDAFHDLVYDLPSFDRR